MQKVLKTAGADRGAVLLQQLQERQAQAESSSHGSAEEETVDYKIDKQIKESINSVKESLKELENQLEEGKYVQTTLNFGGQPTAQHKISLTFEKPPPPKKRVQKAEAKESPQPNQSNNNEKQEIRGGPWGIDEQTRFMDAVRTFGKDWAKITEAIGTRDRR